MPGSLQEDTAFHCCLELKKQNIQMFCSSHRPKQTRKSSKPRSTLLQSIGSLAYHTLALVPPIVLDNLLPYHMTVSVFEVHQPEVSKGCSHAAWHIQSGPSGSSHKLVVC